MLQFVVESVFMVLLFFFFFFQAEDGIRDDLVTGVQTCALPIVAVTRHPTQSAVDEILEVFAPDVLQTDLTDLERLTLPAGLGRLPVLRAGGEPPATVPRRVLFEGPRSGSGAVSDWNAARDLARRTQLVLAGGLNAGNVAAAIAAVRPFGVDVSSGVELEPGIKNPLEIASFVRAARAASGAAAAAARSEDES